MPSFDAISQQLNHALNCARRIGDLLTFIFTGIDSTANLDEIRRLRRDLPLFAEQTMDGFLGSDTQVRDLRHYLNAVVEEATLAADWLVKEYGRVEPQQRLNLLPECTRRRGTIQESCNLAFGEANKICSAIDKAKQVAEPAIEPCPGCGSQPAALDVDDVCPSCGAYFYKCGQIPHRVAGSSHRTFQQIDAPIWTRIPPSEVRLQVKKKKPSNQQEKSRKKTGGSSNDETHSRKKQRWCYEQYMDHDKKLSRIVEAGKKEFGRKAPKSEGDVYTYAKRWAEYKNLPFSKRI